MKAGLQSFLTRTLRKKSRGVEPQVSLPKSQFQNWPLVIWKNRTPNLSRALVLTDLHPSIS